MKINKIELLKNKNKKWFWRMRARNGKILSFSESYSRLQAAYKTAFGLAVTYSIPLEVWK